MAQFPMIEDVLHVLSVPGTKHILFDFISYWKFFVIAISLFLALNPMFFSLVNFYEGEKSCFKGRFHILFERKCVLRDPLFCVCVCGF